MASLRIELLVIAVGLVGSGLTGYGIGRCHKVPAVFLEPAAAPTALATEPDCSDLGVKMTIDGKPVFAKAARDHDLAGHKYRRGGDRMPWFTVQSGDVYVHASGLFLPNTDVGRTELSILTIRGSDDTYELAKGGDSYLEVLGSDGRMIRGRFVAEVRSQTDRRIVITRGTFCLPAKAADPGDTGP